MNKLKSIFISAYVLLMCIISIYGIYVIFETGLNLIWIGAVLTTLPFLLFLCKITLLKDTPRTSSILPIITLITDGGFALAVIGFIIGGSVSLLHQNTVGLFAAILGCIFYGLYLFWYSRLDRQGSEHLAKGETLPEFELKDEHDTTVSSKKFQGKKTIYLFYRGNWCPLCMAQIKEVAKSYQKLEQLGAQVVLISPQPSGHTKSLAEKFDVAMQFYIDDKSKAARKLKIVAESGLPKGFELLGYDSDTVLPTVIITDENNLIIYSDLTENYRVRPHPDEFIQVLA
jgi:peroxiredoxin